MFALDFSRQFIEPLERWRVYLNRIVLFPLSLFLSRYPKQINVSQTPGDCLLISIVYIFYRVTIRMFRCITYTQSNIFYLFSINRYQKPGMGNALCSYNWVQYQYYRWKPHLLHLYNYCCVIFEPFE